MCSRFLKRSHHSRVVLRRGEPRPIPRERCARAGSSAGHYCLAPRWHVAELVRCTVTDMKGGKTIRSSQVTVTGGTAARLTISGTIVDENGVPVAAAIVNNYNSIITSPQTKPFVNYGATNFVASGETAADGKFRVQIIGLPSWIRPTRTRAASAEAQSP